MGLRLAKELEVKVMRCPRGAWVWRYVAEVSWGEPAACESSLAIAVRRMEKQIN